jgi:O-antigen/teichoic acid export membrane protein
MQAKMHEHNARELRKGQMNNAGRSYLKEFGGAMAAYVVVLLVAITIVNANPTAPWRYVVVVLPVVPLCFALLAFLRYFRRMDELQRRIQLEALAFSFGVTTIVTITYGFLERAGAPHLPLVWVAPLMIGLWGLGAGIASRHYQE